MKVVLVATSKFHFFPLARQLHDRNMLAGIFTGYPKFKLKNEGLPPHLIRSFPWIHVIRMRAASRKESSKANAHLEWLSNRILDGYAATHLPNCDIVMSISNMGLRTGLTIQSRGGAYICDRPCSHIRFQDQILRDEYSRLGLSFSGIDQRTIVREEKEYLASDCIVVPSTFSLQSFEEIGFPTAKIRRIPLGVDLARFKPVAYPDSDSFDVLFASSITVRKGVSYLLEAFDKIKHPRKKLTIVGAASAETIPIIEAATRKSSVVYSGHIPHEKLKELMSRSHVFVLPTIEDGFGMVMAEAMACGCPVISTTNSGGPDLYTDGKEGFIIPIRDVNSLADRMQEIATSPKLRAQMSQLSLQRVQSLGGWNSYGDNIVSIFKNITEGSE